MAVLLGVTICFTFSSSEILIYRSVVIYIVVKHVIRQNQARGHAPDKYITSIVAHEMSDKKNLDSLQYTPTPKL